MSDVSDRVTYKANRGSSVHGVSTHLLSYRPRQVDILFPELLILQCD